MDIAIMLFKLHVLNGLKCHMKSSESWEEPPWHLCKCRRGNGVDPRVTAPSAPGAVNSAQQNANTDGKQERTANELPN